MDKLFYDEAHQSEGEMVLKTDPNNIDKFIAEALAIETEEAQKAGAVGYMARVLTQATMPHKATSEHTFTRENGAFSLSIMAHPKSNGLPYGSYPRLLMNWLTTEAVLTKHHELELGPTLSGFMTQLGLIPAGGRWGTIHRLRDQMTRLFSSSISWMYSDEQKDAGGGFHIARKYQLWWSPKSPDQVPLWRSTVTLSRDFFDEVIDRPVPVDMRAIKALKRSPLALDIYCWLTHRMSYLRKPTLIPWAALQLQFGADYSRGRDFKKKFLEQLRAVHVVYPKAKVEIEGKGLLLKPGKAHIMRKSK